MLALAQPGLGRAGTETTASNPLRVFAAARPSSADDAFDGGFRPAETEGCVWWRESERGVPAWIDISGIYIFYGTCVKGHSNGITIARHFLAVSLLSCRRVPVVRRLNLPAVYICRGGKPIQGLAVSLERSIISSSDSATVAPWYVKHFWRKRVNKPLR